MTVSWKQRVSTCHGNFNGFTNVACLNTQISTSHLYALSENTVDTLICLYITCHIASIKSNLKKMSEKLLVSQFYFLFNMVRNTAGPTAEGVLDFPLGWCGWCCRGSLFLSNLTDTQERSEEIPGILMQVLEYF